MFPCPWLIAWTFCTHREVRQVHMHEGVWAGCWAHATPPLQCWKSRLGKKRKRKRREHERPSEKEEEREQDRGNSPVAREEEQWRMPRMSVLEWGLSSVQHKATAKRSDEEKNNDIFTMLLPQNHNTFHQGWLKLPIPFFCLWNY